MHRITERTVEVAVEPGQVHDITSRILKNKTGDRNLQTLARDVLQITLHDVPSKLAVVFTILQARIIDECRREAFETEGRRGCSHVRPTQAYRQSVEEAEREQPRRAMGPNAGAGIHD
jgi:ATP-dependent protease Clp ATPase subunit